MLSQNDLKQIITACPGHLPRTDALEQRIQIGVGFHNKWYRSQKEHWLGWIVFQEYKAQMSQRELSSIPAKERWRGLNCIPMMFWLAEAAGVHTDLLAEAEAIAEMEAVAKTFDCPQHGKAMRKVLPWPILETALSIAPKSSEIVATQAGREAYERLAARKSKYRRLRHECDR